MYKEATNTIQADIMRRDDFSLLCVEKAGRVEWLRAIFNGIKGCEAKFASSLDDTENYLGYEKIQLLVLDCHILLSSDYHKWITYFKDKNCCVLLLNNDTYENEIVQGLLTGGADDYLTTPYTEFELSHKIDLLLKLSDKNKVISSLQNGLEKLEESGSNDLITMYNDLQVAYKELELRKKELESLDKAKSDFIKIVSHEIRTPLSGIIGFSELLKSKLPSGYNNYLDSLKTSALRLQEFSNKAILISKLKTNSYRYETEPVSVVFIVKSILEKYGKIIQDKKLTIRNSISHRLIKTDFYLIEKAFSHIIDNAIRYAPENSNIFIEELFANEKFSIMIIDEGPGFTDEVFDTLFGLFAHGEKYIDKNVGLGLYMVKLILNYMGGSIKVANNKEGGAVVKLIFRL